MPLGLNRNGDYRNGNPVTLPHEFGNVVDWTPDPARFGNPINEPKDFGNKVTWPTPDPAHFGNKVGGVPAVPTFDPPAGSYGVPQVVQIISDGNDAIYFTTDGSIPTTASRLYQGSVYVPKSETIKAIAVVNNVPSAVGSAAYVITSTQATQPTPTFSPVAGTYSGTQNVTITSASADAIYYTTDGSTPTTGSTLYTGPVAVSTSETLKALAVRPGFNNSAIGSAAYVITSSSPVLVAHTVAQQASSFTQPGPSPAINTTGANFIVMGINSYDNQNFGGINTHGSLVADALGAAPVAIKITGATATATNTLQLVGTFSAGGGNAYVGQQFAVNGYNNNTNNGYFICTASTTTTIDLTIAGAIDGVSVAQVYVALSVNKWKPRLGANDFGGGSVWYTVGTPTVGANHFFLEDDRTNAADGSSFAVAAFSGVQSASDPYLQTVVSAQTSGQSTVQAPALTPTAVNNLVISIVTGLALTGPETVDSSYVITDSYQTGSSLETPAGMAYRIAPSTTPEQPTWTFGATIGNRAYTSSYEFAHA